MKINIFLFLVIIFIFSCSKKQSAFTTACGKTAKTSREAKVTGKGIFSFMPINTRSSRVTGKGIFSYSKERNSKATVTGKQIASKRTKKNSYTLKSSSNRPQRLGLMRQ